MAEGASEPRRGLTPAPPDSQPGGGGCVGEGAGGVSGQRPGRSWSSDAGLWPGCPVQWGGRDIVDGQPIWKGMKKPWGSVGKDRGGHPWHDACVGGQPVWRGSRRTWNSLGMGRGGQVRGSRGGLPAWNGGQRLLGSGGTGAGGRHCVLGGGLPAWKGRRRLWGSQGMDGGGHHRVPIGAWPAWTGTRKPCHSQGIGVGVGVGVAGGVEMVPLWMQQALELTGRTSWTNPGEELLWSLVPCLQD